MWLYIISLQFHTHIHVWLYIISLQFHTHIHEWLYTISLQFHEFLHRSSSFVTTCNASSMTWKFSSYLTANVCFLRYKYKPVNAFYGNVVKKILCRGKMQTFWMLKQVAFLSIYDCLIEGNPTAQKFYRSLSNMWPAFCWACSKLWPSRYSVPDV